MLSAGALTSSMVAGMAENAGFVSVEVVYALPEKQHLVSLQVPQGCTALQAAELSGLLEVYPALREQELRLGIFSKPLDGRHLPLPDAYVLAAHDRVEIYRPLLIDPKQARMQKVIRERKEARKAAAKGTRSRSV